MNKAFLTGLLSLTALATAAPAGLAQSFEFSDSPAFARQPVQSNVAPLGGQAVNEGLADGGQYMAGGGDAGWMHDNAPTSDAAMTFGNQDGAFYVKPPDTTHTQRTRQNSYQGIAPEKTRTGLLAPISTMQFGDTRSFKGPFSLGFPGASGVSLAGRGWNAGVPFLPIFMPTTGTPSVDLDVTRGGGY
jgi:hypothetical protein